MHTITRLYDTARQATDAVGELKRYGFDEDQINLIAHAGSETAGSASTARSSTDLAESIMAGGVLKAHALDYAQAVRQGRSLVSVRAVFGTSARAIAVLERFGPVEDAVQRAATPVPGWDDAAPLSSVLWAPTLSNGAAPFSQFWHLPVLSGKASSAPFSGLLALPLLTRRGSTLSSKLGIPMLTRKGSTLSSKLGIPLLLKRKPPRN